MSRKGAASLAPYVAKGYEYRSISDPTQIYSITEPFSLNENKVDGIKNTWEYMTVLRKTGGMVSSFANSYYKFYTILVYPKYNSVFRINTNTPISCKIPIKRF